MGHYLRTANVRLRVDLCRAANRVSCLWGVFLVKFVMQKTFLGLGLLLGFMVPNTEGAYRVLLGDGVVWEMDDLRVMEGRALRAMAGSTQITAAFDKLVRCTFMSDPYAAVPSVPRERWRDAELLFKTGSTMSVRMVVRDRDNRRLTLSGVDRNTGANVYIFLEEIASIDFL